MSLSLPVQTSIFQPPRPADRIVVVGGSRRTIDLLRMATIRSDEVVLVAPDPDAATRRFVDLFAIELKDRCLSALDLRGSSAVLVSTGELQGDNKVVRAARRLNIPVHVAERPLVSDFTLMELVERSSSASSMR
jgi:siroheme synthase (precorrin-2 oxidase/ferrochelatase)